MSKKIVVLQSNYIPWKGYFDLISDADILVIYDDVQFTKNDWRNRNIIKTHSGNTWLSVPVGQNISRNINEVEIKESAWQKKHWKTLCLSYQKTTGFKFYHDFFYSFYMERKWNNLSEMNEYLICNILKFLKIDIQVVRSEPYQLVGKREDRLLMLLKKLSAMEYITGPAGLNYLSSDLFAKESIKLTEKTYGPYPKYNQPYGEFQDSVSILDLLFCCGENSHEFYKSTIK